MPKKTGRVSSRGLKKATSIVAFHLMKRRLIKNSTTENLTDNFFPEANEANCKNERRNWF